VLAAGIVELAAGIGELAVGIGELAVGIGELAVGIGELCDGVTVAAGVPPDAVEARTGTDERTTAVVSVRPHPANAGATPSAMVATIPAGSGGLTRADATGPGPRRRHPAARPPRDR
jgi:X-X-X-Leu-X-X-Gly heptad repeat protein